MSRLAKLTPKQLEEVKRFEDQWTNVLLLAYEKPAELAKLSPEQLEKIKNLEKELGIILVAYK